MAAAKRVRASARAAGHSVVALPAAARPRAALSPFQPVAAASRASAVKSSGLR